MQDDGTRPGGDYSAVVPQLLALEQVGSFPLEEPPHLAYMSLPVLMEDDFEVFFQQGFLNVLVYPSPERAWKQTSCANPEAELLREVVADGLRTRVVMLAVTQEVVDKSPDAESVGLPLQQQVRDFWAGVELKQKIPLWLLSKRSAE